jgi:tetratricopeptide (TPR) repeat protein
MNQSQVIRYTSYVFLAGAVIWALGVIFNVFDFIGNTYDKHNFNKNIEANDLRKNNDSLFDVRIDFLIALKKYDDAISQLKKRNMLSGKTEQFDIERIGDIYQIKKEYARAYDYYSTAIKLDTSFYRFYEKRAIMSYRMNKLDDAISDLKKVVQEDWLYKDLGFLLEKNGNLQEAKAAYDSCLLHFPNNHGCKIKLDSLKIKMKH